MPERTGTLERWRALGRLLPPDVRERIFEPAYSDLIHAWLMAARGRRRLPFGMRALGTYLGCIPIAVPRLFLRNGHLTRFGRLTLLSAAVVVCLVLVLNLVRPYANTAY